MVGDGKRSPGRVVNMGVRGIRHELGSTGEVWESRNRKVRVLPGIAELVLCIGLQPGINWDLGEQMTVNTLRTNLDYKLVSKKKKKTVEIWDLSSS